MKAHVITLDARKHRYFLEQDRQDPVTGEFFQPTDRVVLCAGCRSAFLEESWEYIGKKHCHQVFTLAALPNTSTLRLRNDFIRLACGVSARPAAFGKRLIAFLVDVWVSLILSLLIMLPIASLYFWLRDTQYGVGKSLFGMQVLDRQTGRGYTNGQSFRRNFWLGVVVGMPHFTFVLRQFSASLSDFLYLSTPILVAMAFLEWFRARQEQDDWIVVRQS